MFVSPLAWIRNTGGLVNPRLEKMICCRIEEQPCTTHISYSVCALVVHDSCFCTAWFSMKCNWIFFSVILQLFLQHVISAAVTSIIQQPALPACLSFPQSPHHQLPAHLPLISPIISWFIFRTDYALQLRLLSLKPLSVSLSGFLHPNCAIKPSGNKPPGLKEMKPAKKGQTEVP